jgi:type I restriction enzyme S subunit
MTNLFPLRDVAKIRYGYSFPSSEFQQDGIPVIRMSDLENLVVNTNNAVRVSSEYLDKLADYRIEKGDLIIGMSGSVGKIAVYNESQPALQNQRIGVFKIHSPNRLDVKYLKYFSYTLENSLLELGKGVAIKNISAKQIEDIPIPLPPLPEQKCIAAILEKADRLRRRRRYARKLSDTFLQSVFLEMFGEYLDTSDSEELVKLGSIADIVSGVTKGRKIRGEKIKSVPYLRVANVQAGYLDLAEISYIDASLTEIEKYLLIDGDIVMTEGGDYDKLGRGALWRGQIKGCIHQNHIFRVRLDTKIIIPQYFEVLLQTDFAKRYFLRASKQTTNLATINSKQLKSFPVPISPFEDQLDFLAVYREFNMLRLKEIESDRQIELLFQSLLYRAFRGGALETDDSRTSSPLIRKKT